MAYVDGFVLAVQKKNRAKYKKMANDFKNFWKMRGALDYKECRLDQAKPNKWVTLTFPKLIKAKKGEEVWFSYVVYKNKQIRDKINKDMEKEMAKEHKKKGTSPKDAMKSMPFDMKRMAYGGFTVEVDGK